MSLTRTGRHQPTPPIGKTNKRRKSLGLTGGFVLFKPCDASVALAAMSATLWPRWLRRHRCSHYFSLLVESDLVSVLRGHLRQPRCHRLQNVTALPRRLFNFLRAPITLHLEARSLLVGFAYLTRWPAKVIWALCTGRRRGR